MVFYNKPYAIKKREKRRKEVFPEIWSFDHHIFISIFFFCKVSFLIGSAEWAIDYFLAFQMPQLVIGFAFLYDPNMDTAAPTTL